MATGRPATGHTVRVYLEEDARRTFAMAVDWPGWGRAGRDAEAALASLLEYRPRYLAAIGPAAADLPDTDRVDVVARVPGNATTRFGAPGVVPPSDHEGWSADEARRQVALLEAAWSAFDDVVAAAPATLRKGPRGGGRDRDAVAAHVLDTEPAYARKAGLGRPAPKDRVGLDALRADLLGLLVGSPGPAPDARGWPAPYVVRRMAWHALDHAWEIEDRAGPAADQPPATGAVRS